MAPRSSDGSEFRIQPSVILSEEYNDNVLLVTDNMNRDYIARIAPSLTIFYSAPNIDLDAVYAYNYRYYAKGTMGNDTSQALNLTSRSRIIKELLFLDVRDEYARVSTDVLRDYTQESNFVNQSDRNIVTINPFMALKPTSHVTITAGYLYMNTWYKDPAAVDSTDHIGYVDARHELSLRSSMIAGAKYTMNDNNRTDYKQYDVYVGEHFENADNSTINVKAGNSWFSYESRARTSQVYWDANFTQRLSTFTISYETGLRFIPDPLRSLRREDRYIATVRRDVERTAISVSGGMIEYRDAESKHLENVIYRLSGNMSRAITALSRLVFDISADRLEVSQLNTYSNRYLAGLRFEQQAMENLTLSADYRYSTNYSPDTYSLNYFNNRFSVELRKVF